MAVEWYGDNFIAFLTGQLSKNLELAAIHLVEKIKQALNRTQPYARSKGKKGVWYKGQDPSKPGESPKKIRGDLQRSIAYAMSADRKEAYVGTNIDYGFYLEVGTSRVAPRPFLRSTLLAEQATIAKIISTGSK